MKHGQPSGSSMPLCWAHAEYVSLVHSCHAGYPMDQLSEAFQRYVAAPAKANPTAFWSFAHRTGTIPPGTRLIVLLDHPDRLRWKSVGRDGWEEIDTTHLFARLHFAEIDPAGGDLEFRIGDDTTTHCVSVR